MKLMTSGKRLTAVLCVCLALLAGRTAGRAEGAFGYIDREGNPVIPCQFSYAYEFYSGRARVFSGTLNQNGYPDEGRYGYIDEEGQLVIPCSYDQAADFDINGQAVAAIGGRYGIIGLYGETVVEPEYDNIYAIGTSGLYMAYRGEASPYQIGPGMYTVLRADGSEVFHGEFEYLYANTWCCEASQNGKKAMLSLEGELLTDYIYDDFGLAREDSMIYRAGGLYGYLDYQGNRMTEPLYEEAGPLIGGRALVRQNGKYRLIDRFGTELASYDADYMSLGFEEGVTYAFSGSLSETGWPGEGAFYLLDLDTGARIGREYAASNRYNIDKGIWLLQENGIWYAVDLTGREIVSGEEVHQCGTDRFLIGKDGSFALADEKGNILTDYIWTSCNSWGQGLICVQAKD